MRFTARLAWILLLSASFARAAEAESEFAARAAALQARIFTIDTHLDTPTLSLRRPGWDITARHAQRTDYSQCDFPRMRDGGLKAAVFAVYLDQGPRTPDGYASARDNALRTFLRIHALAERYPDQCGLALTADDGPRLFASGKIALYLSIENGYAIGRDLSLLETYRELGARFFGFVHNGNNDLADSAQPDAKGPEWGGLSPLGREAVTSCNRLGLVIDASHAAETTTRQLIALSQTPVILTHSACAAVHPHKRNVSDEVLRELAAKGGVIQVNTVWSFLVPEPADQAATDITAAKKQLTAKYSGRALTDEEIAEVSIENRRITQRFRPVPPATLDDYLKHLFHAIDVAGVDHVGIGGDMDGGGGVGGLEDVAQYPKITLALLRHGLSEADVEKIWGGNTRRMLRAAEEFAAKKP